MTYRMAWLSMTVNHYFCCLKPLQYL